MIQACRMIQNPDIGLTINGIFFDIYSGKDIQYSELDFSESKDKLYISNWYGDEKWLNSYDDIVKLSLRSISEIELCHHDTIFRKIPGFSNYAISRNGTVVSIRRKRLMKRQCSENGYFVIHLSNDFGKSKLMKLHILVAITFIGERIPGYVIDHLDGNKFNPKLENLEYVSPGENTRRSLTMGIQKNKVWDESEIRIMCSMLQSGSTNKEIEEYFAYKELSHRSIIMILHLIRSGKYFRDISKDYIIPKNTYLNKKDCILSEDDVKEIRNDNRSIIEIANSYGVSTSTISKVKTNKTFKYVK